MKFTKRKILILISFIIAVIIIVILSPVKASALTEKEIKTQVAASSKEAVTGNILIWFLCAIAFMKISQKIETILNKIGINVVPPNNSMVGELMIALRGLSMVKNFGKKGSPSGGGGGGGGNNGQGSNSSFGGFAGTVGRRNFGNPFNGSNQNGSLPVSQTQNQITGDTGNSTLSLPTSQNGNVNSSGIAGVLTAGKSTGNNNAILALPQGTAAGSNSETNSLSNYNADNISAAMCRLMGYTNGPDAPTFSNIKLDEGMITGIETSSTFPSGALFRMCNAEQYMPPNTYYETVQASDNSTWYKQYADRNSEFTPYQNSDGGMDNRLTVSKELPEMPQRKDQV